MNVVFLCNFSFTRKRNTGVLGQGPTYYPSPHPITTFHGYLNPTPGVFSRDNTCKMVCSFCTKTSIQTKRCEMNCKKQKNVLEHHPKLLMMCNLPFDDTRLGGSTKTLRFLLQGLISVHKFMLIYQIIVEIFYGPNWGTD